MGDSATLETVRPRYRWTVEQYHRIGIAEVWIVNLPQQCLEVYRQPDGSDYRQRQTLTRGRIAPAALPDAALDLAELFP